MNLRSYYCWTQDKKEDKRLYLGFSGGSVVKNLPANPRDVNSILELERSPGRVNGNVLQYSCLGNPMDRGTWQTTVYEIAKSHT